MKRYICVYLVASDEGEGEYYHSIQEVPTGASAWEIATTTTKGWDVYDYNQHYNGNGKFQPMFFFVHPNFAKSFVNYKLPITDDTPCAYAIARDIIDVCRHFAVKRQNYQ